VRRRECAREEKGLPTFHRRYQGRLVHRGLEPMRFGIDIKGRNQDGGAGAKRKFDGTLGMQRKQTPDDIHLTTGV